jgi:hypothetical protein
MQVRQLVSRNREFSRQDIEDLAAIQPQLVLCFADPAFFDAGADGLRALAARFPAATFLGCSSAGEISNAGVTTGEAVITAVSFAQPTLITACEPIADMADSEASGARLGARLATAQPHTVMVFGQGVRLNGSALIRGLRQSLGNTVSLIGGLAGDAGRFERTFVISGNEISDSKIVGLGFISPRVRVTHGCFGGWRPFGPVRRVTRALGNVLFELDGEPALAVYRRYLGEHAAGLPGSALLFPFSMLDDQFQETGVTRTILGMDEALGSLTLAGEILPDGFLRLMCANADELITGAEVAAEGAVVARDEVVSLGLLVSCVGRRLALGARVEEEVEAVAAVLGERCLLTGFYSNGEISSLGASPESQLHNQTMTVTRIAEAA